MPHLLLAEEKRQSERGRERERDKVVKNRRERESGREEEKEVYPVSFFFFSEIRFNFFL